MTTDQRAHRAFCIALGCVGATFVMAAIAHAQGAERADEWWALVATGISFVGIAIAEVVDD